MKIDLSNLLEEKIWNEVCLRNGSTTFREGPLAVAAHSEDRIRKTCGDLNRRSENVVVIDVLDHEIPFGYMSYLSTNVMRHIARIPLHR